MFYKSKIVCEVHVGVKLSITINIVLTNPFHSELLFLYVEVTLVFEDIRETNIYVHLI